MRVSGTKLADANVWLALAFSDHLHHAEAKRWFDTQGDDSTAFCRVTQLALLRHLTNAKIMGKYVQSQRDAWLTFDRFAQDPRVTFLVEPFGVESVFRNLSQAPSPSHERWTDAYLAGLAMATQSQLVTFDTGFRKFSGLDLLLLQGC